MSLSVALFASPLAGQTPVQGLPQQVQKFAPNQSNMALYINESQQVVNVLSTPVIPNGRPSIIRQLQPGQSYSRPLNIVGVTISFQMANGGQVEERTRPNHIGLVAFGGARPNQKGKTYVNRTNEVVNIFEQQGVSIPPSPPTFVRSLQPNQMWTDGPTRVSPLSFKLSSGTGKLREVIEQTAQGQMVAFVKEELGPNPGPMGNWTTYINRTGRDIQVYSQSSGAPGYQTPPRFETTIPPSGSYRAQTIPGSPTKSFRLADGIPIMQSRSGNNTIELTTNGMPNPGAGGTTYVNMTGQQVQVYSQQAAAPGYRQPPQYETTIPNGGTYYRQSIPGSPSKTFRLAGGGNIIERQIGNQRIELISNGMPVPGGGPVGPNQPQWGPWQPMPGGGTIQWNTIPGGTIPGGTIPGGTIQWEVYPGGGQWPTRPGIQWQTNPGRQWQPVPGLGQPVPGLGQPVPGLGQGVGKGSGG